MHGNIGSVSCQQAVANAMDQTARDLGDLKFVLNVGDSFYPRGVSSKTDPQWDLKWRRVYSSNVRAVPWYSVYGNHDYMDDPCVCSANLSDCAQVSSQQADLDYFYMPNTSWHRAHSDLHLEVVALDTNYMWKENTCRYTTCPSACEANLKARMDAAVSLFHERVLSSTAKNLVVFSHYPTDYFIGVPGFLERLRNSSQHIEFFGGHRHNVDQSSTVSIAPNNNWLTGGGGGWSWETYSNQQGFIVGEIDAAGQISTYPVFINISICQS